MLLNLSRITPLSSTVDSLDGLWKGDDDEACRDDDDEDDDDDVDDTLSRDRTEVNTREEVNNDDVDVDLVVGEADAVGVAGVGCWTSDIDAGEVLSCSRSDIL